MAQDCKSYDIGISPPNDLFFLPIGKNTRTRYEAAARSTVMVVVAKNDCDNRYNIIVLGSFVKNTAVNLYGTLEMHTETNVRIRVKSYTYYYYSA